MKFKEAVKDVNKKFIAVAECIPETILNFILVVLFVMFLPLAYPIAIIIRMVKK